MNIWNKEMANKFLIVVRGDPSYIIFGLALTAWLVAGQK